MSKSKTNTAIVTISKNQAISYVDSIKNEIMIAAENDARMNFSVGKMLSALNKGNAHIINGNKSFHDFVESAFSSTGKTFATMRQWMVAYDHLNGLIPESEMLAWKPSNIGKIPAKLDADFRKAVSNGEITPATKQDAIDEWIKAHNTDSKPKVVTMFSMWDMEADKPLPLDTFPLVHESNLLTKEAIKSASKCDGILSVHIDSFKPENKPEILLVIVVCDDGTFDSYHFRAYSSEAQRRDKEAAEKQAAKEAALADLAESLHLSGDDLIKFLAIAKSI